MAALEELRSAVTTLEEQEPLRITKGISSIIRGAGQAALEIPKTLAVTREKNRRELSSKLKNIELQGFSPQDPEESTLFQAAEAGGEFLTETFPRADLPETEFFEAVGSTGVFVATGAVGRLVGLSGLAVAAGTGALVNFSGQFQDARNHGASFEDSYRAGELGGLGGLTEGVPIARLFDRIDKASGGQITNIFKNAIKGGLEEGIQEALFQQLFGNLVASDLVAYDKDRQLFEGTDKSFKLGFSVGALFNFIGSALGIKLRRAPVPGVLAANVPVTVTYNDGTETTGIYTKTLEDGSQEVLIQSEETGEAIPLRVSNDGTQITPIENAMKPIKPSNN